MGYVVRMPQLGMTMEEGVVVEWRFEEGEGFEEGDVIAVVESEKTTNDVEARQNGVFLDKFVELEETVEPGDPIAYVGEPDESVPDDIEAEAAAAGGDTEAAASETTAEAESPGADGTETASGGSVDANAKVSPRARTYARDNDLPAEELAALDGSGPGGAVVEQDVIDAAEAGVFAAEPGPGPTGAEGVGSPDDVEGRGIYERREGSRVRQVVAERMTASAREAPQVTLNRRVPVDELLHLKERLAEDRGLDLSLSDFLVASVVEAVEEYPEFNAIYEDGVHKLASNVNVGLAVDVEDGLLTPVVKGADRLTLSDIAAERSRLVDTVLAGDHTHDDVSDGTFTITNLGHFDVETFDPIVNPPQVAILGVGAVREEYDPDADEAVSMLGLSLTFDHRAVDGADGARFLDALAETLTHPLRLLTLASDGRVGRESESEVGGFRQLESPVTDERAVRAHSEEGMRATIRSRRFEWTADEPEDVGGDDTAPNPVEQFLGGLTSCLSLTFRNVAQRREVPVESVTVDAEASPDDGLLEAIDLDVTVVSDADEGDLERVLETAERACYVNQSVADDVERSVALTVQTP